MARPLSLDAIAAECKKLGLADVQFWPGARGIDRPGVFDPIGITIHITAGGLGSRSEQSYIDDIIMSDPAVPVKANAVGAPDGTLWLTAQGNSNHANQFSPEGKRLTERAAWPLTGSKAARGSLTGWSRRAYGIELIAATRPNAAEYRTAVIWAAALCRLHGWRPGVIHGHGEISANRDFGDPGINMGAFRRAVAALLAPKPAPKPAPINVDREVALLAA